MKRQRSQLIEDMKLKKLPFTSLSAPLLCIGLIACSSTRASLEVAPSPTVTPQSKACSSTTLRQQIEEIARTTGGPVGVAVTLLESDDVVKINGQQKFPMQSVYKLPIGMAVLQQIDQGKLKLEQKVAIDPKEYVRIGMHSPIRDKHPRGAELPLSELLRLSVSESDGTASDVLMRTAGGAAVVQKYLLDLGINGMMVLDTEKEIGKNVDVQYRNWATPEGALALLKVVAEGRSLSAASHKKLLEFMTETQTGLKRIKGELPAGALVAHKTGTGFSQGLTRAVNDIGLVTLPDGRRLAIAVFVSDTKLEPEACEAVIAKISRAAWDCWTN
ncbi:MAG TPA: class A beta-lactamase [Pyrinomonadaceae bacterium]|nr:class A beta-lactamase [Pyrinomonadaceae bacterium]